MTRRWVPGWPMWILLSGLALMLTYELLTRFHVGKFGAPTDIGGGLVALVGMILALAGGIAVVTERVRGRRPR